MMKRSGFIFILISLLLAVQTVVAFQEPTGNMGTDSASLQTENAVISLTAVNYEGTYDSQPHKGGAIVDPADAIISYSLDEGQNWSENIPSITETGMLAYQVKAEKNGYETVYAAGTLTVLPLGIKVTVIGNQKTNDYDNLIHTSRGYEASADSPLYDVEKDIYFSGKAAASWKNIGIKYMGLAPDQFFNTNKNFSATFDVIDGYQKIVMNNEVIVTVRGHTKSALYNGEEMIVSGYDLEINNPLYTEADFDFTGIDEAKRSDIGISYMGLSDKSFHNHNESFTNVKFVVYDGYVDIRLTKETFALFRFQNVDVDGNKYMPQDLEEFTIDLSLVIRNSDGEEITSDVYPLNVRYLVQYPDLKANLKFRTDMPDLKSGRYSVLPLGIPDVFYGDHAVLRPEGGRHKYLVTEESWIDEHGDVIIQLTWVDADSLGIEDEEEVEIPAGYLEDQNGAYVVNENGEKEYLIFRTYDICMRYLGNQDLCLDPARIY